MKEEKLTYEILHEIKVRQDRLIAEGKMEKPQRITRDFTPEEMEIVKRGVTLDVIINELEEKFLK